MKDPISKRRIEVPYAFRNGRSNLIQPVGFQATDAEQTKITACRSAVEGKSLYESPDPHLGDPQLIVVGKSGSKQPQSRPGVERIRKEHHVRLHAAPEVDRLVDEIRRTAKEFPQADTDGPTHPKDWQVSFRP